MNLTLVVRVSNRAKLGVQLEQLGLPSHLECWSHTAGYLLSLLLLPEGMPEAFSRHSSMGGECRQALWAAGENMGAVG